MRSKFRTRIPHVTLQFSSYFHNMHPSLLPCKNIPELIPTGLEGKSGGNARINENWNSKVLTSHRVGEKKMSIFAWFVIVSGVSIINLGMNLFLSFLACRRSLSTNSIRSFFINYNCKQRRRSAFEYVKSVVIYFPPSLKSRFSLPQ